MKNSLSASSVCGLVGLVGTVAVLPEEDEVDALARRDDGGVVVVYGAKGGNTDGFWATDCIGGLVFGAWGR